MLATELNVQSGNILVGAEGYIPSNRFQVAFLQCLRMQKQFGETPHGIRMMRLCRESLARRTNVIEPLTELL